MKKPELYDFDLTEEKIKQYKKQEQLYYNRLEEHCRYVKSIKITTIWLSLLVSFVVLIVNIANGFHSEGAGAVFVICVFWDVTVVLSCFDSLNTSVWDIGTSKKNEIRAQTIDRILEESVKNYNEALRKYQDYLKKRSIAFWKSLNGFEFEKEIAKLFKLQGYDATVTPATADGGVDIILKNDTERIAVQCKHHAKPVGPNDVRALQGVVASQNYTKGIFVSLNGYTSTVYYEVNNGNVQIELLDLTDILRMTESLEEPETSSIQPSAPEHMPRLYDIVTHKSYGNGIIINIVPKENNEKNLTVDFAHSIKKFVFPHAFLDGFLVFSEDTDKKPFGEYSFNDYWMFAKKCYQDDLNPNESKDYSHLIDGLVQIMSIEGLNFEDLVKKYEGWRHNFYYGGIHYEESQKYGLIDRSVFERYLEDIRAKRMSIMGFHEFLIKEAEDNEIYLANKLNDKESIVTAFINGKEPIEKLKQEQINLYIERVRHILTEENISISELAFTSSCASRTEINNKYVYCNEPNADMVLEWLTRYYKKTIATI